MPSITIRHVPDDVRDELAARAAGQGPSLQEYLLGELEHLANKPDVAELMAEVSRRKRASGQRVDRDSILADLSADRR